MIQDGVQAGTPSGRHWLQSKSALSAWRFQACPAWERNRSCPAYCLRTEQRLHTLPSDGENCRFATRPRAGLSLSLFVVTLPARWQSNTNAASCAATGNFLLLVFHSSLRDDVLSLFSGTRMLGCPRGERNATAHSRLIASTKARSSARPAWMLMTPDGRLPSTPP